MTTLFRLNEFLKPYIPQVFLALFSTLGLTAAQLLVPTIIQNVIDIGLTRGDAVYLLNSALILLGIGALRALFNFSQRYLSEWIATHIGYDFRNRLYDHIQHLSFSYHDQAQTGQIISRVIEDVRAIERFTGLGVVEMIRVGLLLIGINILLFSQHANLAIITIIPLIILILITSIFGSKIGNYFMDVDVSLGELSARLQENVSGVQVVRAFARERFEIERFERQNRLLYEARLRVINAFSRVMPSSHFLISLGTILVLWFGGRMVLAGEMTIGEVVAFNGYLLLLAIPARQLAWLVNMGGEAIAGLKRNLEILDTEPEIQSPSNAVFLPRLSGKVEFRNVCFKYQKQNIPALEDINLIVEPNQIVALIGSTGSGKSSLVNLIPRFYDATSGTVLIDDIDVREVELSSLRRQIGIVLQSSLLFSITIAENIAYGRPDATMEEIEEAAKVAQAHDFIEKLPQQYETTVGEKGVTLSGGQRQRIAIARALLMNPRILILDDSTSSVDVETEQLIQQALLNIMENRTTFIIAHRLSTVRRADLILVMHNGKIVERGKHQQLLDSDGVYRQIYNLQLKQQETSPDQLFDEAAKDKTGVFSPPLDSDN